MMNIYVYKLALRACPSLLTCWAVRANSVDEAMQWQNWTKAPKHDRAVLVSVVEVGDEG